MGTRATWGYGVMRQEKITGHGADKAPEQWGWGIGVRGQAKGVNENGCRELLEVIGRVTVRGRPACIRAGAATGCSPRVDVRNHHGDDPLGE